MVHGYIKGNTAEIALLKNYTQAFFFTYYYIIGKPVEIALLENYTLVFFWNCSFVRQTNSLHQ